MEIRDDDLIRFEAEGAAPLPVTNDQGYLDNEGARIWYAGYGSGAPVILLHGGLGNSGNWGYQVPALVRAGYRVVVVDSRGHGRSTRDARPYIDELMAYVRLSATPDQFDEFFEAVGSMQKRSPIIQRADLAEIERYARHLLCALFPT